MKRREEQLTWAKHRALICVDIGRFSEAVAGFRVDLDENPLTKGVISTSKRCADTGGRGRGARPGFASADRVDRELRVTHCRAGAGAACLPARHGERDDERCKDRAQKNPTANHGCLSLSFEGGLCDANADYRRDAACIAAEVARTRSSISLSKTAISSARSLIWARSSGSAAKLSLVSAA